MNKKSGIWETLNLSMCMDSISDTQTNRNRQKGEFKINENETEKNESVKCHLSHVKSHMSGVMYPVSRVTCRASPVTNGKKLKTSRGMPILVLCSSTRSLQSTGKRGFQTGTDIVTDIATYRLIFWSTFSCKFNNNLTVMVSPRIF